MSSPLLRILPFLLVILSCEIVTAQTILAPKSADGMIYLEELEVGGIYLMDQFGRSVYIHQIKTEKVMLNLEHEPDGVYYLQVKCKNQFLTSRIVKI